MSRTVILVALACALTALVLGGTNPLPAATATSPASPSVGPAFDSLMPSYDAAREALAADRLGDLAPPARELRRLAAALGSGLTAAAAGVPEGKLADVRALFPALRKATDALAAAATQPAARDAFFDLSKALIAWRKLAQKGPDVAYCSMSNRSWLQAPAVPIENPYGGRQMARCGQRAGG